MRAGAGSMGEYRDAWEIDTVTCLDPALHDLLANGWEPFAVNTDDGGTWVWLRRQTGERVRIGDQA